ncbi:MAG: hypothetical protein IJS09_00075 [Treponema sp.]|nr:hypothetical protein [Treponema sp.]
MKADLNKILICVVFVLGVLIIGGTTVAVLTKRAVPGKGLRKDDPTPEQVSSIFQKKHEKAFTKIGQLRSSTAPDENDRRAVVVVTPWLEYSGDDEAFYEELDTKLRSIKAIFMQYFINYTVDQLLSRGEALVKADLLSQINDELVLGKVTAVYFNEYQFLD